MRALFATTSKTVTAAAILLVSTAAAVWAFTAPEDAFSIDFPGTPQVNEQPVDPSGVRIRMYTLAQEPMRWAVFVATIPEGVNNTDEFWFDLLTPKYPEGCFRDDRRGTLAGGPARDLFAMCEATRNKAVRVRQVKIGNRLYMAMASGEPGSETSPQVQKFIDSFQPTPPSR